jgi:hypothetical protein
MSREMMRAEVVRQKVIEPNRSMVGSEDGAGRPNRVMIEQ